MRIRVPNPVTLPSSRVVMPGTYDGEVRPDGGTGNGPSALVTVHRFGLPAHLLRRNGRWAEPALPATILLDEGEYGLVEEILKEGSADLTQIAKFGPRSPYVRIY